MPRYSENVYSANKRAGVMGIIRSYIDGISSTGASGGTFGSDLKTYLIG